MMDDAGKVSSEEMEGHEEDAISEPEDEEDESPESAESEADDTITRIQQEHYAAAAAARRRRAAKPKALSQKRKMEAVKTFHDFTKKLKKDTGISIRSIVGKNILNLSDFSDSDASESDSDGLSEEEFVVNPGAVKELTEDNESYIDPETGDIVERKPKTPEPPSEIVRETVPEEPKTLSISDIINEGDLDLTKNVEIAEVEQDEFGLEKTPEDLDIKQEENSQDAEAKAEDSNDNMEKKEGEDGEDNKDNDEDKKSGGGGAGALNVRRNIREVMDEKQLDASTLAAQRQESERLARVQEQQRIIREVQRQLAINRQNKNQQRAMSLLQGNASILKKAAPGSKMNLANTVLVKLPSGEIKRTTVKQGQVDVSRLAKPTTSAQGQKPKPSEKTKEVVEIVDSSSGSASSSSSDSDDCIMLSDSELPPSPEAEDDPNNSGLHVNDAYNTPDEQGRVLINIGHPDTEEDIFLAPQIARIIKPHQIGGVRFLYDNIIESTTRFSTSSGFGCILAHSMGLGKTLQVVCFCDVFLRHTPSRTVLCVMPINTLQNWVAEFNKWLPLEGGGGAAAAQGEVRARTFPIYVLNDSHKTLQMRAKVVKDWSETGGVLMIGYELYRLLSMKKDKKPRKKRRGDKDADRDADRKDKADVNDDTQGSDITSQSKVSEDSKPDAEADKDPTKDPKDPKNTKDPQAEDTPTDEDKKLLDEIYGSLVKPGPDLVICDEGHRIKNSHSNISFALKQMRTKRRVVLTGYPLQNNLLEYWCMVDFVRPNYLGSKTEFSNMFERPIQNGQCIDSTPQDIRLMRYRAHVLHSLLVGFVQRRSHAVLQCTLPQKEEFVLLLRMTPLQRQLYERFMNEVVRLAAVPNPLKAFAICCKIWNHPDVLYNFLRKRSELCAVEEDLDLEELAARPGAPGARPRPQRRGAKTRAKAAPKKPAATIQPNTTSSGPARTTEPHYGTNQHPPGARDHPDYPYPYPNTPGYYPGQYNQYGTGQQYYPYNNYPNQYANNPEGYNQSYWGNGTYPYNSQAYQYSSQYQNQTGEFGGQQYPPNFTPPEGYPANQAFPNQSQPNAPFVTPNQGSAPFVTPTPGNPPFVNQSQSNTAYANANAQAPFENQQYPPGYQNAAGQYPGYNANNPFAGQTGNSQAPYPQGGNSYPPGNANFPPTAPGSQVVPFRPPSGNQPFPTANNASYQNPAGNPGFPNASQAPFQGTGNAANYPPSKPYPPTGNPSYPNQSYAGPYPNNYHENSPAYNQFGPKPEGYNYAMSQQNPANLVPKTEPFSDDTKPSSSFGGDGYGYNRGEFPLQPKLEPADVKPPPGQEGPQWPLIEPVKTDVDKLKQETKDVKSPSHVAKSESDGEVKIADLDSKAVLNDDSTKPAKGEAGKTDKKDADEQKTKKGKDKKEKKSPKAKPKAKGRKDRKTSKDKEKDSNSEESEKEEKMNREEELAMTKKAEEVTYDWAAELLKDYIPGLIESSAKMELFFYILNESIKLGDRLLLFSQSLFTLNLIEDFLERNYIPGTHTVWERNTNYYRLDGSTHALEREKLINEFNANPHIYLFLVSTRAGSLGINLVGANRVIVFDASWNPCHDTQAVCRVYRYGQKKPCFVYRFVMDSCLEKKIYDRQINKQGMADRVVDECNPDAVLSMKEITNLCFDNDEKETEVRDLSEHKSKYIDVIMQGMIELHGRRFSKEPFQHESLLVDRKEKKLSSAEKRLAQRGYELEKKAACAPKPLYRPRPVASVRPMQHSARWIPADVWRRQGMSPQELTLPLDVVIPTNSAEKTNIVLKAGQRVMVLKSPKGIYMQLESGKIIAIKTSLKGLGQKTDKDGAKKVLARPTPANLPGSLKNNSAITVTSKSGARGQFQRAVRPGAAGRTLRPLPPGARPAGLPRLDGLKAYGPRKPAPPRPRPLAGVSITKVVRSEELQVLDSEEDEKEPQAKEEDKAEEDKAEEDKAEEDKTEEEKPEDKFDTSGEEVKTVEEKEEPPPPPPPPAPAPAPAPVVEDRELVLTTDESLPSEAALERRRPEPGAGEETRPPSPRVNPLKNYRHQRPAARPAECSLSRLERTASALKEGVPFRRTLDTITQGVDPAEERTTKSRRKKTPTKIEPERPPIMAHSVPNMAHSVSNMLAKENSASVAPLSHEGPPTGVKRPAAAPPMAPPMAQPYPVASDAPYGQYPPGYGVPYGAYGAGYYGYGAPPYYGAPPAYPPAAPPPGPPPDQYPPNHQW